MEQERNPDWIKIPFTAFYETKILIDFLLFYVFLEPNTYYGIKSIWLYNKDSISIIKYPHMQSVYTLGTKYTGLFILSKAYNPIKLVSSLLNI